ncbi:MAG: metallophosphoesterase family protein [Pirellulales bacterium]|nr:metallophosphoesterase family protein [Pirellulales bacterium]
MKVALLGDVHGNLPALEAVLADARSHDVEAVWNLGDFLGYGPFPDEVVRRLRTEGALSILGNYDAKVLAFEKKKDKWRVSKRAEKYLAFRWAHQRLSEESRRYLRSLPSLLRVEAGPRRVLLTHGSPAADDEALGPETPKRRLEELARLADADLVACGHTHRAFERRVGGVRFVNPGSVGRPEGGDPRANWTLLKFQSERFEVAHRRIEYDVERTVKAIRRFGLPEDFARMLLDGKNLKQVQCH